MRKVNFKRVLDALTTVNSIGGGGSSGGGGTSGVSSQGGKNDLDIPENLTSECFQLCKIVRHGFPYRPTALTYDPVQKLLAIGTRTGSIRILGQPGVDVHVSHDVEVPVIQLLFLINEGGLISICADDSLHMWNLRQKKPAILHSLKFNKERITFCHLPYKSKWLYIGTERGNVHLCYIETFVLSGYTINWNKAIDLSQKVHPGSVVGISENPCDENKLLVAFESGLLILWDLKSKIVDHRYHSDNPVKRVMWHHEGKQFMCCHNNGSLSAWNYRNPSKPQQVQFPHAKGGDSSKFDSFHPIDKLEWKTCKNGEPFVIFSGGLSTDRPNIRPSVTVMRGRSVTVLEMDYNIVDFIAISHTPWQCDSQDPSVLVILLDQELVAVDLTVPGYPCIEFPHPIDIHDSPVTCLKYVADSNSDLTPGLYQVAATKPKRNSGSKTEWPMTGGKWSIDSCNGFPEIVVSGHADGSVRFWDASAVSLKALYKLRTYKFFKRPGSGKDENFTNQDVHSQEDDPFAISHICICPDNRTLVVSNLSSTVMLCQLSKQESSYELDCLEIPPVHESHHDEDSPSSENAPSTSGNELKSLLRQESDSLFVMSNTHKNLSKSYSDDIRGHSVNQQMIFQQQHYLPLLRLKGGSVKQSCGFQAMLFCQFTGTEADPPPNVTEIEYNSAYGLIVVGSVSTLCVIDVIQRTVLLNMATTDVLYSIDRKKQPRSPCKIKPPVSLADLVQIGSSSDQSNTLKSPSSEGNLNPNSPRKASLAESGSSSGISPLSPRRLSKYKIASLFTSTSRKTSLEPVSQSNNEPKRSKSHPSIVLTPSGDDEDDIFEEKSTKTSKSSVLLSNMLNDDLTEENPKKSEMKESIQETDESTTKPAKFNMGGQRKSVGSIFRKGRNLARLLSTPDKSSVSEVDDENKKDDSEDQEIANGNHISHSSGSRTPHREMSSSSMGSSVTSSGGKLKKPPYRLYKKGSFSFEKSLDSQASVNTEESICSRASSVSDLDRPDSRDIVSCLKFANTYARKGDQFTCPCLWVGTSTGFFFNIVLNFPACKEQRAQQPVMVSPSGWLLQLRGAIIDCCLLNSVGQLVTPASISWREAKKLSQQNSMEGSGSLRSSSPDIGRESGQSSNNVEKQFMVLTSEKQIKIISLPTQSSVSMHNVTNEVGYITQSKVAVVRSSSVVLCHLTLGYISVFSFPSLNPLFEVAYLPPNDIRTAQTLCFTPDAQAMYMPSASEIQRLTCSEEVYESIQEITGHLFIPCEAPERPNPGFFKGLFGGGVSLLDREELFGESSSGKASRSVAKYIPGTGGASLEGLRGAAQHGLTEMQKLRLAALERGEKLGELEEKTQKMQESALKFSENAHSVMLKYKNKKWYQL